MRATPDLIERFPPLFQPYRLDAQADVLAHAAQQAGAAGAGAVFHGGRADRVCFAVVLEPEEPLRAARRVLFCGMNALAETLAADAPPERAIGFRYPDAMTFDGGLIGGLRLTWPEGGEDTPPEWLVLGGMLRRSACSEAERVHDPAAMSLEDAGLGDAAPEMFVARFCRHLMADIDEWQSEGFAGVGKRYLQRLEGHAAAGLRGLDRNGDLIVQAGGERRRTDFVAALQTAGWIQALTGRP